MTFEWDDEKAEGVRPASDDCVVAVQVLDHLRLSVRFRDGLTGEVILKESHLRGVFEALRDPAVFAQVSCKEGFVEWPGEIDLARDPLVDLPDGLSRNRKFDVWLDRMELSGALLDTIGRMLASEKQRGRERFQLAHSTRGQLMNHESDRTLGFSMVFGN